MPVFQLWRMQTILSLDCGDWKQTITKTKGRKSQEMYKNGQMCTKHFVAAISAPMPQRLELMFKLDRIIFQDPLLHLFSLLGPKVSMTAVVLPQFVVILTQPFSWYACCKFVVTWCVCHKLHGIRKFLCVAVPAWVGGGLVSWPWMERVMGQPAGDLTLINCLLVSDGAQEGVRGCGRSGTEV